MIYALLCNFSTSCMHAFIYQTQLYTCAALQLLHTLDFLMYFWIDVERAYTSYINTIYKNESFKRYLDLISFKRV